MHATIINPSTGDKVIFSSGRYGQIRIENDWKNLYTNGLGSSESKEYGIVDARERWRNYVANGWIAA